MGIRDFLKRRITIDAVSCIRIFMIVLIESVIGLTVWDVLDDHQRLIMVIFFITMIPIAYWILFGSTDNYDG